MRIYFSCLLAAVLILLACNEHTPTTSTTNTQSDSVVTESPGAMPDTNLSGCYSLIAKRDTASFQVQVKGTAASGSLSYNLFEKDRNDGSFEGEIHDDILIGWYLFRSEGIMSVRQVAWKIQGNNLLPANGEVLVRNDSAMFKDPNKLTFDNARAFVKTKCII